ncbi:MAG: hypothetical protein FD161_2999 [Limisphaerales bacterium]|nr:MAG: hypothetical protein FD161_2999 [Limisphaerales bacterium]KAG0508112.1 MAG: hypothetical protein E1N63_2706 [Limisphaerales bacterium]TXT53035.1 MAG: hypothetical protein FD140_143 [Limisphaerales bacterium]
MKIALLNTLAIESLKTGIAHELWLARSWAMAGWPAEAMHYRRVALKAIRILRRCGVHEIPQAKEQA